MIINIWDHNYLNVVTSTMRSLGSPPLSLVVDKDIPKQPGLELSDKIICKSAYLFSLSPDVNIMQEAFPAPLHLALPKVQAQPGCTCQ